MASENAAPSGSPYLRPRNEMIGDAIAHARDVRGMSQADLAARMRERGAEWHPSTVSALEKGKQSLRAAELADLADVLGVTPGNLLRPDDAARDFAHAVLGSVRFLESEAEKTLDVARRYVSAHRVVSAEMERTESGNPEAWAALDPRILDAARAAKNRTFDSIAAEAIETAREETSHDGWER